MTTRALRVTTIEGVRRITLCRADEYNTITLALREELETALRQADNDPDARVVLLDAEGPAFCAGYGLDWATPAQANEANSERRVWDSVRDQKMISYFTNTWALLHELPIPTIAAVQGWCIAGGTNIVFNADVIVAADDARFQDS
jgi:enoyl-CoA hydratase